MEQLDLDRRLTLAAQATAEAHTHHSGCCSHHPAPKEYEPTKKFEDKSKFVVEKETLIDGVRYIEYKDESQMKMIMDLIAKDLSEPYSIYTYRYFIHNWPHLCFLVSHLSSNRSDLAFKSQSPGYAR